MNDDERSLQALLDPLVPEERAAPEWGDVLDRAKQLAKYDGPGQPLATAPRGKHLGRVWRPRVVVPISVGLVACAVTVTLILVLQNARPVAAAGVSFRYPKRGPDKGYIIATVTHPFAAQASLDAAFEKAGLDIEVTLVPASPSAVGKVVYIGEPSGAAQIEGLTRGKCSAANDCSVVIKVPRDFKGTGYITLGRPAKPGEQYETSNDAFAPGEILHCSGLIGKTVAAASAQLAERGISIQWRENGSSNQPSPDEYVVDGIPNSANSVFLFVQPTRPTNAALAKDAQRYGASCS